MRAPSEALQRGREALADTAGVTVLTAWQWLGDGWARGAIGQAEPPGAFALRLRLQVASDSPEVPAETDWYLLAEEVYPDGQLGLWPAKVGGLRETFPHQLPNLEDHNDEPGQPFRAGRISVTDQYLRQRGDDDQPYGAATRIPWYVQRGLRWLRDAAAGELQRLGAVLWRPMLPRSVGLPLPIVLPFGVMMGESVATQIAFFEGEEERAAWAKALPAGGHQTVPLRFVAAWGLLLHGATPHERGATALAGWGPFVQAMGALGTVIHALRVHLARPLWRPPCRLPETFGELRAALREQGLSLDPVLDAARRLVHGDGVVPLLFWSLVPRRYGEAQSRGDVSAVAFNAHEPCGDDQVLAYLQTSNWHPEELGARGQLAGIDSMGEILIIGAGSLGSAVAELLVRGGARRLCLVDPEIVAPSNLLRHTATLGDVGKNKALVLAQRLGMARPGVKARRVPAAFLGAPEHQADLASCRVVIDCTGNDLVLRALRDFPWPDERRFFSLSLAEGARRLYLYSASGTTFPEADFRQQVGPLLVEDQAARGDDVDDGAAGCHSPTFRARADQVWALAAGAIPVLERAIQRPRQCPALHVISPPQAFLR